MSTELFETVCNSSGGGTGHYINNYRCGGSKPLGGGEVTANAKLSAKDIITALTQSASGRKALAAYVQSVAAGVPEGRELQLLQVENAGLQSSVGHLGALVDELRALLGRAINAMTVLHGAAAPDESTPDLDARIPAHDFRTFVDEHAAILHARANSACATPEASPRTGAVVTDAMVDAYLTAQRATVEEADRFGRPNVGGLHTNTVREACRAGLRAAIALAQNGGAA